MKKLIIGIIFTFIFISIISSASFAQCAACANQVCINGCGLSKCCTISCTGTCSQTCPSGYTDQCSINGVWGSSPNQFTCNPSGTYNQCSSTGGSFPTTANATYNGVLCSSFSGTSYYNNYINPNICISTYCTGTATPCSSFTSQTACQAQSVCSWSSSCSGTYSCSQFSSSTSCTAYGCTWNIGRPRLEEDPYCSGTSKSCSGFSQSQCTPIGCTWTSQCQGTATSCNSFSTQTPCQNQVGCKWIGCSADSACNGTAPNSQISGGYCDSNCKFSISIALSANPSSVSNNQPSIITASTSDIKSGVLISLTTNLGSVTPTSCTTNSSGQCSVSFSSPTTGTATITGSAPSPYTSGTTQVTISNTLSLSAFPKVLTINRISTITATTPDTRSGVSISFATNLGVLNPTICSTNSSGQCSVTLNSTTAGNATVTGSASGYNSNSTWVWFTSSGCTFSLTINPASANYTDTSNSWTINATDSSSASCPTPITYTITNTTSGTCASTSAPSSITVNRGGSTTYPVSVTRSTSSCTLTTTHNDLNLNTVATGSYSVSSIVPATCGNGVVDPGENCYNCPADSGCSYGQLCCQDNSCQSNCVTNGCNNNGICEPTETCDCADCYYKQEGCLPGDMCNPLSNKCGCIPTADGICPIGDPVCSNQDPDCTANLTSIYLRGNKDYLYIYWNASAMSQPPSTIGLDCFLNCDPTKSSCGLPSCSQVVSPSSGLCQINKPNYLYDSTNQVACRMYNQTSNYTFGYARSSFKPYDSSLGVSSFAVTVGQDFFLPVTIRNTGLFSDSFTVNISQNNLLYNPNPVQTTNSSPAGPILLGMPENENTQLLFNMKVLALTGSPIGLLVIANSTTNTTHGNALFVQLQSGSASLPDFDIFGVFQLILISTLIFSYVILRKK